MTTKSRSGNRYSAWRPPCPAIGLILLLAGFNLQLRAQNFAVDWLTVDGGGGSSTGGVFLVTGTIGQPDASLQTMTGGSFAVTGGFWALNAVPGPNAPRLTILLTMTNTARVLWPAPSSGFTIQQNSNLSSSNWLAAPEPVMNDGTNKFILVSPPVGNRFYRLIKP